LQIDPWSLPDDCQEPKGLLAPKRANSGLLWELSASTLWQFWGPELTHLAPKMLPDDCKNLEARLIREWVDLGTSLGAKCVNFVAIFGTQTDALSSQNAPKLTPEVRQIIAKTWDPKNLGSLSAIFGNLKTTCFQDRFRRAPGHHFGRFGMDFECFFMDFCFIFQCISEFAKNRQELTKAKS